jgi:hypothetical protein
LRGAREDDVAPVGRHRAAAHGREAEGGIVGLAEERRLRRPRGDVHQHARHEGVSVEGGAVGAQRRVGLGAARNVAVHRSRQVPPRGFFEILEREDPPQGPRQGPVDLARGDGVPLRGPVARGNELCGAGHAQSFTPSSATTRCTAARFAMRSLSAV